MALPSLTTKGMLPLGRYGCSLEDVEARFVDGVEFSASSTRGPIYEDFLSAIELFRSFHVDLVESVWVGGSFVTSKVDPSDIDCLFILSEHEFDGLPSNSQRQKVLKLAKKDYLKTRLNLDVESFVLIRRRFANPWQGGGVTQEAAEYTQIRGAWDDWWLRSRSPGATLPLVEDSVPVHGYVEVNLHGQA